MPEQVTIFYNVGIDYPHEIKRHELIIRADNTRESVTGAQGTYSDPDVAYEVAYALCWNEHKQQPDYAPGDERFQYPEHPIRCGASPHMVL